MDSPLALIGMIAEALSWVGLGMGVPLLLVYMTMRAVDGRWLPTHAVVVGGVARWFAAGEFHEERLSAHELAEIENPDEQRVYYSERDPSRIMLHPSRPSTRLLGVLATVLLSVGALGLGVSIAAALLA